MEQEKRKKSKILPLIIIIILIILGIGSYFVWFYEVDDSGSEITKTNTADQVLEDKNDTAMDTLNIKQGNLLDWSAERISFYLPTDWSYEVVMDENYMEKIVLTSEELSLDFIYEPISKGAWDKWNVRDNIIYKNTRSVLFIDEGNVKGALSMSKTITETNLIANTEEEQEYGLFIVLTKDNESIEELSDTELSYIKYIMDQYEENN